jgi:hypothetical protein
MGLIEVHSVGLDYCPEIALFALVPTLNDPLAPIAGAGLRVGDWTIANRLISLAQASYPLRRQTSHEGGRAMLPLRHSFA